eukprot:symbB.v1.2.035127.t1/scaffold4665.1/size36745/5
MMLIWIEHLSLQDWRVWIIFDAGNYSIGWYRPASRSFFKNLAIDAKQDISLHGYWRCFAHSPCGDGPAKITRSISLAVRISIAAVRADKDPGPSRKSTWANGSALLAK